MIWKGSNLLRSTYKPTRAIQLQCFKLAISNYRCNVCVKALMLCDNSDGRYLFPAVCRVFFDSVSCLFLIFTKVSIVIRGSQFLSELLVVAITWWYTYQSYRIRKGLKLGKTISSLLFYSGEWPNISLSSYLTLC